MIIMPLPTMVCGQHSASCQWVVHPASQLSVCSPLTNTLCDMLSLYLVKEFQWNLAQVIIMQVATAEIVYKVRGQQCTKYRTLQV